MACPGERRRVERRVGPCHQRPAAPGGARGAGRLGGEPRGTPGRARAAAAQPGGGDHRRAQRRADRGGQRVQAPHQQALALDFGVAERRALLFVPVDAFLLRVDVEERQYLPAGQQWRAAGQFRQQQPVHLPQLQRVPPGERPQKRPQRGRRPDPAKQRAHRPVPHQVQVIDAVRPADHPSDDPGHLHLRVHPAPARDPHVTAGQVRQASALGQGHHRDQPSPRHQIRVIKRCVDLRQAVQQSHLRGVLSARNVEVSATPIVPAQRAPFVSTRPQEPLFTRWIEAKSGARDTTQNASAPGGNCRLEWVGSSSPGVCRTAGSGRRAGPRSHIEPDTARPSADRGFARARGAAPEPQVSASATSPG